MTFMALMEDLRDAVTRDGRTHHAIAQAAKIHRTTFSAFMHGRRGLSVETVEALAKALHFEIKLIKSRG
jgi:plasmid maintenance system antidote protein VapI